MRSGSKAADTSGQERRSAPRIPGRVRFSSGRDEGEGLIQDLSLAGLHVAEATVLPEPGKLVELYFCVGNERTDVNARAEVVRTVGQGFAARFVRLDTGLQELLMAALPATAALSKKT